MSCSLIEAKFQVLDRTIRMLSKSKSLRTPKVASSEQLRDLVETQKPTSLLPTLNAVKGVVVTRNNQTYPTGEKTSRSQPSTAREEKSEKRSGHSPPRPSTGRRDPYESSTELLPDKWVDPKQRRAEQLLQETWHEIESAVNWGQELGSPTREALRSKLLNESVQDDRQEQESISSQRQILEQYMDNQINGDSDALSAAVHNALPPPKRPLTSTGLQPKKSKAYLSARCRSASFNVSDHQPKNWFAPSAISATENPQQAPKVKRKICRQRPAAAVCKQVKQNQNNDKSPSPPRPEPQPQSRPEVEIVGETEKQCPLPVLKPDDPSFYMLELRLVHPEPLTSWRFQASFTDTSVNPPKTIILDDLMADEENCLLFDDPQTVRDAVSSRYFNPFLYFPGLNRPSDLYGHVLRIIVTSLQPVTRIVINTSVQFTRFPDEAVVEPPVDPVRTNAADAAKQEANLLRVLTRRNNSASSASRRRKQISKPRPKEPRTALKSNNEDSTASLAMDQCNPWSSSGQEDFNSDASSGLLEQMLPLHLDEPRPPSPPASPRKGPTTDHLNQSPMTTIDKKKMQLQRLRANIRREMREEDNCNV
ncbi:hypothetical protein PRIC1_015070 [Phytophthora ramorum]